MSSLKRDRKEALWILLAWVVCLVWTLSVSYFLGARETITFTAGIPNWVWLGIILPWISTTIFSIYFALKIITEPDTAGDL